MADPAKNVEYLALTEDSLAAQASHRNLLLDLEAKVTKAMEIEGARYIHIMVPCPLGWGSAAQDTIRIARLAMECGLFPLFEAEHGMLTGS